MDQKASSTDAIRCTTIAGLSRGQGWRVALTHARDRHVLIRVTRGQGRITVQGHRSGFGAHNLFWLPAGQLWSLDAPAQTYGLALEIAPEAVGTIPVEPQHLRVRDVAHQAEFNALFEALQREAQMAKPLANEAVAAHAALVTIWLRRQLTPESVPARPSAARRQVGRFCDLLAQDFRSGRPMAGYAEALGITPTHLTRICRQEAGKTAADLITERVLHEARRLLGQRNGTVQAIAAALGFSSPAYFTRFITQHTGKTPSALRRATA